MKLKKSFHLAMNILVHSKLRSWLTIIGIIIGIGSVVAILSISNNAQSSLEDQLGSLGADILTVTPGASRAMGSFGFQGGGGMPGMGGDLSSSSSSDDSKNLTSKDVIVIKSIDNVETVMGTVSSSGDLTYLSKTASVSVTGVDEKVWSEITTEELSSGRFLTSGDTYSIVIGDKIATQSFDDIPLNSKVTIEGKTFKIVGILEDSNTVYMPIETARDVFDDVGESEFDSISVQIDDVDLANQTVEDITDALMKSRAILDENEIDFSVTNPTSMQATVEDTMSTISLFLGAIAAISLLVGAIGIANTMFTSVLEKTREIGIMKAIGAKNKDILAIFLLNSGLIGLVGGLGGIALGVFGSSLISSMASSSGEGMTRMFSNTAITGSLLIGALLFSIIIGMIAGLIPAYRASKLKPVDALRYE